MALGTRPVFTLTVGFLLIGIQGGWQSAFSQANPPPAAAPKVVAQQKQQPRSSKMSISKRATCCSGCQMTPRYPQGWPRRQESRRFKPGDHITAKYVEAKLLGVNETAGTSGPILKMSTESGGTVRGPTTIVAVDPVKHTVSFVGTGQRGGDH